MISRAPRSAPVLSPRLEMLGVTPRLSSIELREPVVVPAQDRHMVLSTHISTFESMTRVCQKASIANLRRENEARLETRNLVFEPSRPFQPAELRWPSASDCQK